MPLTKSKAKMAIGMLTSTFWPITAEPEGQHPTYDAGVDMGAAVKGYISVTTASASVPGDDIVQIEIERFTGGQLDVETTMNDLEVNATLFGHSYSAGDGEESTGDDVPQNGGYSFIEPFLNKNKQTFYRATCLRKVCAIPSSEKQEADTKKPGELNPKNNVVNFRILEDNMRSWRVRQDFSTEQAARDFITSVFTAAAT